MARPQQLAGGCSRRVQLPREMRGGRTDQLLSPIRNRIAFSDIVWTAARNFITSGKSHVQVLGIGIGRPSQQRRVVLRRRTPLSEVNALYRVLLIVKLLCQLFLKCRAF